MEKLKPALKTKFRDSIKIVGLGKYLPKKVLTNFDLEKIVDTSDEWITTVSYTHLTLPTTPYV